jgi:hypothetical protein
MKSTQLASVLTALACALPGALYAQTASPTYLGGNQVKTASGVFVVDKSGNPLGTSVNPLATHDANTATIAGSITAPLNAQTTHGVNIGGVEGVTAAGTSGTYPVTVQGSSAGVPIPVTQGASSAVIDESATAFAGSGSVIGTSTNPTPGGGAVLSAEVNVSALTLGTATAVYAILQETAGGTNYTDIWVSDPITATGIVRVPPMPIGARHRWRFYSVGGTSTTVTATITTYGLPGSFPVIRQTRDNYAATNPLKVMYNGGLSTGGNFSLTASSNTNTLYIEGSKTVLAFITTSGTVTYSTSPTVALYYSVDGINFFAPTGSTVTVTGSGTYTISSAVSGGAKFARLTTTTPGVVTSGTPTIVNMGINGIQ